MFSKKRSWSELVSTRRPTVLILPFQWGFPAVAVWLSPLFSNKFKRLKFLVNYINAFWRNNLLYETLVPSYGSPGGATTLSITTPSTMAFSITIGKFDTQHNDIQCFHQVSLCWVSQLSLMLSVFMLDVVMLNVVAPTRPVFTTLYFLRFLWIGPII